MKTKFLLRLWATYAVLLVSIIAFSCKKNNSGDVPQAQKSSQLSKAEEMAIAKAGFSPTNAIKVDGGYVVEGDIFLTTKALNTQKDYVAGLLKGIKTEQYRTTNLVTGMPRVIKVRVDAGAAQAVFTAAATEAIKRYNDLGVKISFTLLDQNSTGEDILIQGTTFSNPAILGQSAGFPENGNPASPIKLSTDHYGPNFNDNNLLATVIAHEIGHAIGFRHTDYADRRYSCGYQSFWDYFYAANEGDGGVGAIYIPGTPVGGEPGSWMLACSDGTNRPFTASDVVAIKALYPVN